MAMTLQAGDKCWVQLNKKHYGICTGYGRDGQPWFVHNTRGHGVIHVTRKGFAGNRDIYIEQRARPGQEQTVARRALALVGRGYDMLMFNCEHVANFAINDKIESKQVQAGAFLTVLGTAIVALFAAAFANDTTVDANGYRRDSRGRFATG